jgi:voltage-gated sodium channel
MDRARLAELVEGRRARGFILAVIVVKAVVLGLETSGRAMAAAGPLLVAIDRTRLAIFVVE